MPSVRSGEMFGGDERAERRRQFAAAGEFQPRIAFGLRPGVAGHAAAGPEYPLAARRVAGTERCDGRRIQPCRRAQHPERRRADAAQNQQRGNGELCPDSHMAGISPS